MHLGERSCRESPAVKTVFGFLWLVAMWSLSNFRSFFMLFIFAITGNTSDSQISDMRPVYYRMPSDEKFCGKVFNDRYYCFPWMPFYALNLCHER